ncbi:hypothetical protein BGZ49_010600 [Haplosporangium sp. Z 27]|nr:hypothetical protein BGZ49_010600 [Haplosporangium sp. Z 27]
MSLLRIASRRSFNVALATRNAPAVARLPIIARSFASKEDPIKHAPGWRGENASDSEASVKADRENHPANVEDLQKQSVEHLKSNSDHAIHDLKEKVEKAQHIVEENVSQVEENTKEFAEKAKKEFGKSSESIVDGVKSGTDKATEFVKESFESVKKAVGMNK